MIEDLKVMKLCQILVNADYKKLGITKEFTRKKIIFVYSPFYKIIHSIFTEKLKYNSKIKYSFPHCKIQEYVSLPIKE